MSQTIHINSWERLANGFDVEFKHNIPVRLSGHGLDISNQILAEEVSALGKLHVVIGKWEYGESLNEYEETTTRI